MQDELKPAETGQGESYNQGQLPAQARLIFWIIMGGLLVPWFWLRCQQSTHSDILWLCESLKRILAGGTMTGDAYETNPPLSLLLYSIPVLLEKYLGVSLHNGVTLQSFSILAACTLMLHRVLKNFSALTEIHRLVIMAGYIVSNTILSAFHFGERDHLIGMVLVPFALIQVSMTSKTQVMTVWTRLSLLLGSVLLLLKPHFGIVPVILILHRLKTQRRLSVLFDADVVTLATTTLIYLGVVWFGFRDYVEVIAPDVLRYYFLSSGNRNLLTLVGLSCVMIGAVYAVTYEMKASEDVKKFCRWLVLASVPCLLAVVLQDKGFYYHYLPAIIFFIPVLAMTAYDLVEARLHRPINVLLGGTAVLVLLGYACVPPSPEHPRHDNYAGLPLAQEIVEQTSGAATPSFFIFNNTMGMMHELAYYTGTRYASRFPGLWFLPGLYYYQQESRFGLLSPEEETRLEKDIERYGDMMADDLNRYQPSIIWMISPRVFDGKIDPLKFFAKHQKFQDAWGHYKFDKEIVIRKGLYGEGNLTDPPTPFNVYKRVSP